MTPEYMDSTQIREAQLAMGLLGRLAGNVNWKLYVATVKHAETIAPPISFMMSPHDLRHATTRLAELLAQVVEQWGLCSELCYLLGQTAENEESL